MTTDRDLIEYVMALPLTPALPLGERREAVRLLLPVVDRIATERAATELRAAADWIWDDRHRLYDRADHLDPS